MEWHPAVEHNHEALKHFVVMLVGMIEVAADISAVPRHLYRAVLRLLRPAEAATRRLIITLARDLSVPPAREWEPTPRKPEAPVYVQSHIGMHAGVKSRFLWKSGAQFPQIVPLPPRVAPTRLPFPLLDPLRRRSRRGRLVIKPGGRDDPINTFQIGLRLRALTAALDDMQGQAQRFARWKARNDARGLHVVRDANGRRRLRGRSWPLQPGKPPGCRLKRYDPDARSYYGAGIREIDRILSHCHALADYALTRHDTS